MTIREELDEVLRLNHQSRLEWIHFHARWLKEQGIVDVRKE